MFSAAVPVCHCDWLMVVVGCCNAATAYRLLSTKFEAMARSISTVASDIRRAQRQRWAEEARARADMMREVVEASLRDVLVKSLPNVVAQSLAPVLLEFRDNAGAREARDRSSASNMEARSHASVPKYPQRGSICCTL